MIEKIRHTIMNTDYRKTTEFFIVFSLIAFLVSGTVLSARSVNSDAEY